MCTALHSLEDPFMFLLRFPNIQQLCQGSLMENACFSDEEAEALSKADIPKVTWPKPRYLLRYLLGPDGLRARKEAFSSAPAGTQTESLKVPLRAKPIWKLSPTRHPRLRRKGGWEPQLCVHLFLIKAHALDQDPALEFPFPGRTRPPSHQPPFPLRPEQ